MSTPVVSMNEVSFSYGARPVLEDISFELAAGEFCMLIGENGAGKSTLIQLLTAELTPVAGTVLIEGRAPAEAALDGVVGYVPQSSPDDYQHIPVSVLELVASVVATGGRASRRAAHEAAAACLEQVGLAGSERKLVGELSGGQFQLALLARSLVRSPGLLLLDEATSNLDDAAAARLTEAVARATSTGTAALFVTHDLARLPRLYTRCLRLEDAHIEDVALTGSSPQDVAPQAGSPQVTAPQAGVSVAEGERNV